MASSLCLVAHFTIYAHVCGHQQTVLYSNSCLLCLACSLNGNQWQEGCPHSRMHVFG